MPLPRHPTASRRDSGHPLSCDHFGCVSSLRAPFGGQSNGIHGRKHQLFWGPLFQDTPVVWLLRAKAPRQSQEQPKRFLLVPTVQVRGAWFQLSRSRGKVPASCIVKTYQKAILTQYTDAFAQATSLLAATTVPNPGKNEHVGLSVPRSHA